MFTPKLSAALNTSWGLLALVLALAAFLRIVFYTGYFGSDEVTYTTAAYRLLDGDWSVATYVGGNRYGINLPVAGFAYVFGRNEIAASLYSLLCSLAEIVMIFCFGRKMFGLRVGALAAVVLASLPLHAHFAGRLMADAPLALAMTSSFLLFWYGEKRQDVIAFAFSGIAAGLSFWIKPVVTIYILLFLTYPLFFWRWNWRWVWMAGTFIGVVGSNSVFFWITTENPIFIFEMIQSKTNRDAIQTAIAPNTMRNTAPEYYLSYLFVRIYHTWLLGLFALGAIVLWCMRRKQATVGERLALGFVTWWSVGLLAVFSLLPVSINPLALISKQTNYMLMFVAPLSLLAGYTLAQFRGWLLVGILVTVLAPSLILIALQQSVVHKVTANSKAAVAFSLTHSDAILFAGTNATRAARFYNLTNPNGPPAKIEPLTNLLDAEHTDFYFNSSSVSRYAVIDAEKPLQNRELSVRNPENVPSCWAHIEILEPSGFGFGLHVVKSVQRIVAAIPDPIGSSLAQTIGAIVQPKPAQVFQIPNEGCSDAQDY